MRSLKGKTISSLFWKLFEHGGRAVVELLVQIVMARLLAPEEFGALAIMLVFVNVGNVVVQSGLNTALVQTPNIGDRDCSTVFWLSLSASLVLYFSVFFCAPLFADFYGMPHIVWPLRVLAFVLIINSFNAVQVAIVQRALEFRKAFNATVASVVFSGVLGVASALNGAGLWALVAQQLVYQLANCVALALQVRWRPRFVFDVDRAGMLFSFGWKLLASGLLDALYRSLSDLIIGKQFSAEDLGLVSQGKKYPMSVGSILDGAIQPVMLSAVSRVQHDAAYVKRLVRRALKTSTYLVVPSMAAFALVAEPLVRLLLGEPWLPCVPFLQMYCFVYALLPIHTANLQALNGMGRSDLFLKLELVKKAYGMIAMLFAAFVLRDVYFLVGSYMLTGVVSTFVNAWPNRKVVGYSYAEQVSDICPAFFLSAISVILASPVGLLALPDVATVVLQVAVVVATYVSLSRLFRVEAFSYLLGTVKELASSRKVAR
ncbi:lipopolysaccharide biosynthesis protein [Gordonibacter sp. An230]|uniref:lipopolysaccharide biosynthesis protein n=1 Tax=Gordonibacter sp. An230 TaxID=1965592 RepID=UPI001EF4830C|nr:lipopolysaccharide biosynthesis protein [Gordonibacter sp. An230]